MPKVPYGKLLTRKLRRITYIIVYTHAYLSTYKKNSIKSMQIKHLKDKYSNIMYQFQILFHES